MNIAEASIRITFQKSNTVIDRFGNHTSEWLDYYSCWSEAVSSRRKSEETQEAAQTLESDRLEFTVRRSTETNAVNSKEYRILLGEKIYNILSVDEMGFDRYRRKFLAELVRR